MKATGVRIRRMAEADLFTLMATYTTESGKMISTKEEESFIIPSLMLKVNLILKFMKTLINLKTSNGKNSKENFLKENGME